jgi:hypothetical protein
MLYFMYGRRSNNSIDEVIENESVHVSNNLFTSSPTISLFAGAKQQQTEKGNGDLRMATWNVRSLYRTRGLHMIDLTNVCLDFKIFKCFL